MPHAGATVPGLLLRDISLKELAVLDAYEEDEYIRLEVKVRTEESKTEDAHVYVAKPDGHMIKVLEGDWSLEQFLRLHYENYLHEMGGLIEKSSASST